MKKADAFSELPDQCDDWDGFMFGDRPRVAAQLAPDEWIAVFELTAWEALAVAFGAHLSVLEHRPLAFCYDSGSGKYLAYPLYRMPLQSGLPTTPEAWRDIWRPLLMWTVQPVLRMSRGIGNALVTASEYADDVARQLKARFRKPEVRDERPQVRAA